MQEITLPPRSNSFLASSVVVVVSDWPQFGEEVVHFIVVGFERVAHDQKVRRHEHRLISVGWRGPSGRSTANSDRGLYAHFQHPRRVRCRPRATRAEPAPKPGPSKYARAPAFPNENARWREAEPPLACL